MSPTKNDKNGEIAPLPETPRGQGLITTSRLRFSSDSISRGVQGGSSAEDNLAAVAEHYKAILRLLGEDPEREGLQDTPMRAAKAMLFFTKGYDDSIESAVKKVSSIQVRIKIRKSLTNAHLTP